MAPVPTPENIEIPGLRGERPIASYDLGPAARGAQALAHGVEALGTGITKSAEDIAGAVVAKRQNDVQNSLMNYSNAVLQLRAQHSDDNDSQSITNWQAERQQLRDQFNAATPPPTTALGAHAHGRADRIDAQEDLSIATRQRQVASSETKAQIDEDISRIGGMVTYNPADPHGQDAALDEALNAHDAKIQSGVDHRELTPLEAEHYRKRAAQRVLDAQIHAVRSAAEQQPHTPEGEASAAQLYAEAAAMYGRPLRQRGPIASTGGAPAAAFRLVSQAETNDPTVGPKALSNISRDSKGTHSYGPMGLNSGSGSLSAFVGRYGRMFGLTAPVGSAVFNAQWQAAATNRTNEFRAANEEWFNENHVGPTPGMLQQVGIPAAVANDPRVVTYFADRHVQQGALGIRNAAAAWNSSNGDIPRFLRNMTQDDAAKVTDYFPSAIASGVYPARGAAARRSTRLNGSLAAGDEEGGPASIPGATPSYGQPGGPEHPAARVSQAIFSEDQRDAGMRKIEASINARRIDDDRQARAAVLAEKQQDQHTEFEYLQKAHDPRSATTATDVLSDPRVQDKPELAEKIIRLIDAANKPEATKPISDATTANFIDRMRKPEGDPLRLTNRDEITDAYVQRRMTRGDYEWAIKQFDDARSGGDSWAKEKAKFMTEVVRPQVTRTDIQTGISNTKAGVRVLEFDRMLERKKEDMIKEGKNPLDLVTPGTKDFMGVDDIMKPWRRTAADDIRNLNAEDTEAAGGTPKPQARPASADINPENAKSFAELQEWVKQYPLLRDRALDVARRRGMQGLPGWPMITKKAAPGAGPQVPPRPASDFSPSGGRAGNRYE